MDTSISDRNNTTEAEPSAGSVNNSEISQSPYYSYDHFEEPKGFHSFLLQKLQQAFSWLSTIDGIVATSFFCNIMAKALPVLLVPMAVEERIQDNEYDNDDDPITTEQEDTIKIAAQVAHITSLAFGGGFVGKFVNGFVCQRFGTYLCSRVYLLGLCLFSLWFSASHNAETMGMAYAGMEFCSSLQYGSMAVMLSNYYANTSVGSNQQENHGKLASALTALGLAATSGEVLAKVFGTFLAGAHHWRIVAKIGAATALLGAALISQAPGRQRAEALEQHLRQQQFSAGIGHSFTTAVRDILGNASFWVLAVCFSMVCVCAWSDRILVSFYYDITSLPHNVCGGLTLSVTLGLVHGLVQGSNAYTTLHSKDQKMRFLRHRYMGHVVCALGLAVLSYYGPVFIAQESATASTESAVVLSELLVAAGVFLLTAAMASTIAFQYFQLPAMIAQVYGGGSNKAVCISWLDGIGYLFSIPTFRALGVWVVPSYGWPAGWAMLSILFGLAATVMLSCSSIGSVLDASKFHEDDTDDPSCCDNGALSPHSQRSGDRKWWRAFDWAISVYEIDLCYSGDFMKARYMPHNDDDDVNELPPQQQPLTVELA